MKYEVVFTVRNILNVFKEVVEADSVEQAKAIVEQMVEEAGLVLQQITSVVQL